MPTGSVGRARHRRGLRLWTVLAAIAASALVLAACGGGDDNGSSSSGASGSGGGGGAAATATPGPKLSGEPIKTMTIAAVNWNGPAYPNILETAKLYEK